ncbi:unnamed protein product, partial [Iphiclides podalirius]
MPSCRSHAAPAGATFLQVGARGGGGCHPRPPRAAPVISLSSGGSFLRDRGASGGDNAVRHFPFLAGKKTRPGRKKKTQVADSPLAAAPQRSRGDALVKRSANQRANVMRRPYKSATRKAPSSAWHREQSTADKGFPLNDRRGHSDH